MAGQKISSFPKLNTLQNSDTLLLIRNQTNYQIQGSAICSTLRADSLQSDINSRATSTRVEALFAAAEDNFFTIENSLLSATQVENRLDSIKDSINNTNTLITTKYIQLPSTSSPPIIAKELDVLTFTGGKWQPYTGVTAASGAILDTAAATIPIGAVMWFAGNTPPKGFLLCNGSEYDTATNPEYKELYDVIKYNFTPNVTTGTKFKIPDLRGQFIRGWDNRPLPASQDLGATNAAARVFGSSQAESFIGHTHQIPDLSLTTAKYTLTPNAATGISIVTNATIGTTFALAKVTNSTSVPLAGTETRPKNVALLPCIKYIGAVSFETVEKLIAKPTGTLKGGEYLSYNSTTKTWEAGTFPLPTGNITNGTTLVYDLPTKIWKAAELPGIKELRTHSFSNTTTITEFADIPASANRITLVFTDVVVSGTSADVTKVPKVLNIQVGGSALTTNNYVYSSSGLFVQPWSTAARPATPQEQIYNFPAGGTTTTSFYVDTAIMYGDGKAAQSVYKKMSGTLTLSKGGGNNWTAEWNGIIGGDASGTPNTGESLTRLHQVRGFGKVTIAALTKIAILAPPTGTSINSGNVRVIYE